MAEKVTSIRLNEEDLEQFKQFTKDNNCSNQAEAFKTLLGMVKLENMKEKLGDRGNSIESFRNTVNKLVDFYVNALQENESTEQVIREELQKELQTKDNTISNLYEQFQEAKVDIERLEANNKELTDKFEEVKKALVDKSKECINYESQVTKLNSNNDLLQEQLQEYKEYKDNYKKLENELDQLKEEHQALKDNNDKLNNDNKQLHDRLNNNTDMIAFYKTEIDNKDKSINEYKSDIKSLEDTHKQQVLDVKDLYKSTLDSKVEEYQEQLKKSELEFNKKLDFELQKKDLEFEKLKNEIDNLKKSNLKTSTPKTK